MFVAAAVVALTLHSEVRLESCILSVVAGVAGKMSAATDAGSTCSWRRGTSYSQKTIAVSTTKQSEYSFPYTTLADKESTNDGDWTAKRRFRLAMRCCCLLDLNIKSAVRSRSDSPANCNWSVDMS